MRKSIFILLIAVILVTSACLWTKETTTEDLSYDGPYVDVVTELARRERTEQTQENDSRLYITKVDSETGLAVPTMTASTVHTFTGVEAHNSVSLRMPFRGEIYILMFEDDTLIGYYDENASFEEQIRGLMQTDREMLQELLGVYREYVDVFMAA